MIAVLGLILLFHCLFRQAIDESRELMTPIIRMSVKLDGSEMNRAHAIRALPGPHFNHKGKPQSRLRNQPTPTRPYLGLEALIAVHVGSRSALCLLKGELGSNSNRIQNVARLAIRLFACTISDVHNRKRLLVG